MSARGELNPDVKKGRRTMGRSATLVDFMRTVWDDAKQKNDEIAALKESVVVLRHEKEALMTKNKSAVNEKAMDELRQAKVSVVCL
jgi:hypothetical protein